MPSGNVREVFVAAESWVWLDGVGEDGGAALLQRKAVRAGGPDPVSYFGDTLVLQLVISPPCPDGLFSLSERAAPALTMSPRIVVVKFQKYLETKRPNVNRW